MADAATVSVLIQARDQASAQLQKVETNMGNLAGSFAKHRRTIGLAATAIGGAIIGIAAISVKSSMDQQIGIRQLDQALQNVGTSYETQKQQIEEVITAQQRKTNFGDEEQRKALLELVLVSGNYDDAMAALIPTMELAAGKEMDLSAAATLVARAISGEETALGRYGIAVEKGAGSTAVLTEIMDTFGGQAEAAADPTKQLMNTMGDLFQVIGDALLPVLETLVPMMDRAVQAVQNWTEAHPGLTKVIVIVGTALGGVLLVLGPILLILPTLVTSLGLFRLAILGIGKAIAANPIGAILTVLTTLALVLLPIVIKNWDAIWAAMLKTTEVVVNLIIFVINAMTIHWRTAFGLIVDLVKTAMDKLPGFVKKLIPGFDEVKGALDSVSDKLKEGIPKIDIYNKAQEKIATTAGTTAKAAEKSAGQQQAAIQETARVVETEVDKQIHAAEKLETDTRSFIDKVLDKFRDMKDDQASVMGEMGNIYESGFNDIVNTVADSLGKVEVEMTTFAERLDAAMNTVAEEVGDSFGELGGAAHEMSEEVRIAFESNIAASDEATLIMNRNTDSQQRKMDSLNATFASQTEDMLFQFSSQGQAWSDLGGSVKQVIENIALVTDTEADKIINSFAEMQLEGESWKDAIIRLAPELFGGLENMAAGFKKLEDAAKLASGVIAEFEDVTIGASGVTAAHLAAKGYSEDKIRAIMTWQRNLDAGLTGTGEVRPELDGAPAAATAGAPAIADVPAFEHQLSSSAVAQAQRMVATHVGLMLRHDPSLSEEVLQESVATQLQGQFMASSPDVSAALAMMASGDIPMPMTQMARGGLVSRGGIALVGERGPEMVSLPGGAFVHPNRTGPGGGQVNNFHFHGAVYGVDDLREAVVEAVRDHALSGGFAGVFGEP